MSSAVGSSVAAPVCGVESVERNELTYDRTRLTITLTTPTYQIGGEVEELKTTAKAEAAALAADLPEVQRYAALDVQVDDAKRAARAAELDAEQARLNKRRLESANPPPPQLGALLMAADAKEAEAEARVKSAGAVVARLKDMHRSAFDDATRKSSDIGWKASVGVRTQVEEAAREARRRFAEAIAALPELAELEKAETILAAAKLGQVDDDVRFMLAHNAAKIYLARQREQQTSDATGT